MIGNPKLIYRLASAAAGPANSAAHTLVDGFVFPANWWSVGKVVHWTGVVVQSAVNGTDTLRARCLLGPTTLTGTAVADSTAVTGAANNTFGWDLFLQAVSTTQITVWGHYSIMGVIGTVTRRQAYSAVTGLDFTAAIRGEVTALFGAASAGNVCACQGNALVEYPG